MCIYRGIMRTMYHSFNFITGYRKENPTVESIEWRLIVLESVAGVPGFVAAGFRHFRSLRTLQKDYGFISTLLEEAENERMHLLVCLTMFHASPVVRGLVIAAQALLTPALMLVYAIHPRSMHRFVGFLEETATETYIDIINNIETPGTHLNRAWIDTPAPDIAKGYWKLPHDAKWIDTLRCICADETHHRDVNHTYASLKEGMLNPFLDTHKKDAAIAWRLHLTGET
jgi:Alternative oxidase